MSDKANSNLHKAKSGKNDEFYTQYNDIEREIQAYLEYDPDVFRGKTILLPCDDPEWSNFTKYFAQNFETFGLKKLISTSYAYINKGLEVDYQPSLLESNDSKFDREKTIKNGKIFILERDTNNDSKIDINDLEWDYLEGDGDFRSDEITALRDEADIIVTNPPFSLFREFLAWLVEGNKLFTVVGNMNAITYKEAFPLIKNNDMWLGNGFKGGAGHFINKYYDDYATATDRKEGMIRVSGVVWFTNVEHGRRHQPLQLMNMQDNLRYNKKVIKNQAEANTIYQKYDNYDAIEVGYTNAIPSDYEGVMGVPISFLDKYNPDQFEILGLGISNSGIEIGVRGYTKEHKEYRKTIQKRGAVDGDLYLVKAGEVVVPYARILIKHKNPLKESK